MWLTVSVALTQHKESVEEARRKARVELVARQREEGAAFVTDPSIASRIDTALSVPPVIVNKPLVTAKNR